MLKPSPAMDDIVAAEGAQPLEPPRSGGLRLVVRDMPFYALANGSQATAGFLALALFTRWLSPPEYGLYALTLTTVTATETVVFSWVNNATLRYLPAYDREGDDRLFLATNFMTTCALLLLTSVLWLALTTVLRGRSQDLAVIFQVGLVVLVARVLFGFAVGLTRARRLTARYAFYVATSALGSVALAVTLRVTLGTGANGILLMLAVALAVPAGVELGRSGVLGWMRRDLFAPLIAKQSAAFGLPLVGATFGAVVLSVADRYMLEYFRGAGEVGAYSAGYDLADKSLKLVFTVMVASSLPVVMQVLSRHGVGEANRVINRTMRVYLVWMVPLTVAVVSFRREIVQFVLGPSFADAVSVVPWVALGTLSWGASQIVVQAFQVEERTSPLLWWLVAAAALNVGLNVWAIPAFGVTGAAITTAVGYGAYLAALWLRRGRHTRLSLDRVQALRVSLAGLTMYAVMAAASPLHLPWVPAVALKMGLGLAAYALTLRLVAPSTLREAVTDVKKVLGLVRIVQARRARVG